MYIYNAILSNISKFGDICEPIYKYTLKIEDKMNNYLRKLKNLKLLSGDVYSKMLVSGAGPGIWYGLPEIHKTIFSVSFPFRPIFAFYNTPCFNIAKYLISVLSPFTKRVYY